MQVSEEDRKALEERVERMIRLMKPEERKSHDLCVMAGLQDEQCGECNRIHLANCSQVIECFRKECPYHMSELERIKHIVRLGAPNADKSQPSFI